MGIYLLELNFPNALISFLLHVILTQMGGIPNDLFLY